MRTWVVVFAVVLLVVSHFRYRARAVVISEFMAANASTLADEDGEFSDWIELYNDESEAIDLSGLALSDDPRGELRWDFPKVVLEPGEFLIVFASGKDRRDPGSQLHTNFRLSKNGEYLGLVGPAGLTVSRYFPIYPIQQPDFSHGFPMQVRSKTVLAAGDTASYFVPVNNRLGTSWTGLDFDDADWSRGPAPIGFDSREEPALRDLIRTDVGEIMEGVNSSLFLRFPFTLEGTDLAKHLRLRVMYNDGITVSINGVELARENAQTPGRRYNLRAFLSRSDSESRSFKPVPLAFPLPPDLLVAGRNVLAIQVLNTHRDDQTLLCLPEIDLVEVESIRTEASRYFETPTPGRPNMDERVGISRAPAFLTAAGIYAGKVVVELSAPQGDVDLRYTTNSVTPTANSTLYEGPVGVDTTVTFKTRAF